MQDVVEMLPRSVERSVQSARKTKVAVVLDDFSERAFDPEWEHLNINPTSWKEQIIQHQPELLFVESTWHGQNNSWTKGMQRDLFPKLKKIVNYCRELGIPTVFWNKEDPAHYSEFLHCAELFDFVFTTDSNKIESYKSDLGHDNVFLLPFAAQPLLHNPRRPPSYYASRDVAFAGTYFQHKFPERREQMELLLEAAYCVSAKMNYGLEIFSRFDGLGSQYDFPFPYSERVIGNLDYEQMVAAYHLYKVFLNVNSVVDSPSMCSRRVFEIVACGAAVVSTDSPAMRNFFPASEVCIVSDQETAQNVILSLAKNPLLREKMVHLGQRRVWKEHTYGHRVDTVLETIGLQSRNRRRPSVSALVSTNRPNQIDHVLDSIAAMNGAGDLEVQLCLLTHGFEIDRDFLKRAADLGLSNTVLLEQSSNVPLGKCYNQLVSSASGDVIAKIDDDDIYGIQYLSDQLFALDYSRSEVVGKQAHYTFLQSTGCTTLTSPEREHRNTLFVAGPTIVTWRSVAKEVPFREVATGEDTGFLEDIVRAGGSIYSSDKYNFLRIRGNHRHTWPMSDWEILAKSTPVSNGCPYGQIFF